MNTIIIVALLATIFGGFVVAGFIDNRRDNGLVSLSATSTQVMLQWLAIPEGERPENPRELLAALDQRYELNRYEAHYDERNKHMGASCGCRYYSNRCRLPELERMYNEFFNLKKTIHARNEKMQELEREGRYEGKRFDVELYLDRLRTENEIQAQVTKELF